MRLSLNAGLFAASLCNVGAEEIPATEGEDDNMLLAASDRLEGPFELGKLVAGAWKFEPRVPLTEITCVL